MSRTEKLFNRLDELEAEYRNLAAEALEKYLRGSWSVVHRHLFSDMFRGKFWRNEERAHFEWLEKEIEALCLKLDQPLSASPVGQMRALAQKLRAAWSSGDGMEFPLARELLKFWGHEP